MIRTYGPVRLAGKQGACGLLALLHRRARLRSRGRVARLELYTNNNYYVR